jgi:hypothetical protein
MTDLTKLKELAERALLCAPGEWFVENGIDQVRDGESDFVCETGEDEPIKATYIAAANPQAILGLIERLERAEADAARYRWLCASAWYVGPEPRGDIEAVSWHDHNDTRQGVTTAIDAALEGDGR